MRRPELSVEDILAVLNRRRFDYVIDAFAAIAQGAPLEATHDVDVTPRRDADNLHCPPLSTSSTPESGWMTSKRAWPSTMTAVRWQR